MGSDNQQNATLRNDYYSTIIFMLHNSGKLILTNFKELDFTMIIMMIIYPKDEQDIFMTVVYRFTILMKMTYEQTQNLIFLDHTDSK